MKKFLFSISMVLLIVTNSYSQDIPRWKITDVEKLMMSKEVGILVLNFWATFCKPCVAEIPSFIRVAGNYKNDKVKLVLVSLDLPSYYPGRIKAFVNQHQFIGNIAWLQETNADYFCPKIDSAWSGSIPATLILNTKTGYRFFIEGEMTEAVLEAEIKKAFSGQK